MSIKQLVLASSNAGKLRELTELLSPLGITIIPQSEFNVEDAEETGLSFIENALIKARHASEISGLPALADDSGITVKVLRGAPGIYSARFAHDKATDQENLQHLLGCLKDTPDDMRSATFVCALALVMHSKDPVPITTQGKWNGSIAREAKGENGFGYDPIFLLRDGRHAAELTSEEKAQYSHRSQALTGLKRRLLPVKSNDDQ